MKAYLATTGVVFGLITLAHFARVSLEGLHLARDPVFVGLTVLTAGLCLWAGWLYRSLSPPRPPVE